MTLEHTDNTKIGTVEAWLPMGAILQKFGHRLSDYSSKELALEAVRHLCKKNAEENDYDMKVEVLDEQFPEFSKFWWVDCKGKAITHTQVQKKQLDMHGDIKNLSQIDQAKMFMEGLGCPGATGADSSNLKIENVKHIEMMKSVELLKLSYLACTLLGRSSAEAPVPVCIYICVYKCIYIHIYIYIHSQNAILMCLIA